MPLYVKEKSLIVNRTMVISTTTVYPQDHVADINSSKYRVFEGFRFLTTQPNPDSMMFNL